MKRWFQYFLGRIPFKTGNARKNKRYNLHSDAFQNFLCLMDHGTLVILVCGKIALYHPFSWFVESTHRVDSCLVTPRHTLWWYSETKPWTIWNLSNFMSSLGPFMPMTDSWGLAFIPFSKCSASVWRRGSGLCVWTATKSELHLRACTFRVQPSAQVMPSS